MDVSIIIVNYNTKDFLRNCLVSIYKNTKNIQFEIIVSDNGSIDGSVEMIKNEFPGIIVIENTTNIGFGAANNRALNIAKGEFVFFLNSDTIILNNAIKIFHDYWKNYHNPDLLGAIGCNLMNENYETTNSRDNFFNFFSDFKMYISMYINVVCISLGYPLKNKTSKIDVYFGEVDTIIGADLFMKNDENAYFDEYFFLYHEETDLEYRLAKKQKKRLLIDGPLIIHLEGRSDTRIDNKYKKYISFARIHDYISRIKFYRKNKHNALAVMLLKCAILIIWTYPPIISYTRKYIKGLLRI